MSYELDDAGWATAMFGVNDKFVEMGVSYLHDSLLDLANLAIALSEGEPPKPVILMEEPGEYQIHVSVEGRMSYVTIRHYEDWESWGLINTDLYDTALYVCVNTNSIVEQIRASMIKIYEEYGMQGYKKKWMEHEFPIEQYNRLV